MSATLQPHTFEIPSVDHKKCSRKRFYFEDELSHNMNKRVKAPFHSDTNFSPSMLPFSTSHSCDRDKKFFPSFKSNNIALKKNKNLLNLESSYSEMSRIIDLSTGESLESVSNIEQHDRQKLKRTLELVEHDYKDSPSVEGDNFPGIMGDPTFGNNNFHKKIRTSKKPTVNYIEDVEDAKDDSRLINNNTIGDFKNYVTTSPSISNTSTTSNFTIDPTTKSLPLVVRPKKFDFTTQYQDAFNKYMRSQLDTVKDDYSVHGKEIVLYRQNNKINNEYIIKDDNNSDDYTNSEGKIVEIEDDDIQMLDTDETNASEIGVGPLFNESGQGIDGDDKMDIDE